MTRGNKHHFSIMAKCETSFPISLDMQKYRGSFEAIVDIGTRDYA